METAQTLYPEAVVNSSKFIIEEYIDGDEYAVDAYYDKDGNPVILNIFQHPFLDSKDVRDRIYLMSAEIMVKYMSHFALLLKQIGDKNDIKNFPMHIEVRVTKDEKKIPIGFGGFLAQKKPDWNSILEKAGHELYYFSMAEVPSGIDRTRIKSFDYEGYLANFSNVLEVRRINPNKNPLFAVIFGSAFDKEEVKRILSIKTESFMTMS